MAEDSTAAYDPKSDSKRKAKSNDPGWKYGYWPDLADKNMVRCKLCDKNTKGGIKRLKEHLSGGFGDAAKCPKVTEEISKEMRNYILKNKRKAENPEIDFNVDEDAAEEDIQMTENTERGTESQSLQQNFISSSGTSSKKAKAGLIDKRVYVRGSMDAFVRRTPEDVIAERLSKKSTQTTMENRLRSEEERNKLR